MASGYLSSPASSAAPADDRRAKAEQQLEKEREKLRAKQAAVERAKERQRARIEADRQRARGKAAPVADAQTRRSLTAATSLGSSGSSQYGIEQEEKRQDECDARLAEQHWRREQAAREDRLRQAEEAMSRLRAERERVEAEIEERRRQVLTDEAERQQRMARDREEEAQRLSQRQAQVEAEERSRKAAEEEATKEAMRRDARATEQEERRRRAAVTREAEEAARKRQDEAAQQRRDAAARVEEALKQVRAVAEVRRVQQAEKEADIAAASQSFAGLVTPRPELSDTLDGITLPSWNVTDTQPRTSAIEPPAVLETPTPYVGQAAASEVGLRPSSSASSRPSRRSAWNIPVRPDSPSSVASAPSLLSRLPSWANNTAISSSELPTLAAVPRRQARLHRRSLPAIPSSPFPFTSQPPSSATASPSHSATSEPASRRSSLLAAVSAPPRFSRQHLVNAVTFSLLPSPSLLASRLTVLALLQSTPPAAHLLLMLHASPSSSLTLRAVFVYRPDSRDAVSVWEGGSATVGRVAREEELDRVWKYDSGKKAFVELPGVRSFAPTSHAFTLQKRVR